MMPNPNIGSDSGAPRFLPEDELENGHVYEIRSRNLTQGVWVAEQHGFIGIRRKFDSRYLFMEYHHDHDPHVGTVQPVRPLGVVVPEEIPLRERTPGRWCGICDAEAEFVPDHPDRPVPGRNKHVDRTLDRDHDPHMHVYGKGNPELFDFLDALLIRYATANGRVRHIRDCRPPSERLSGRDSLCGRADLVNEDCTDEDMKELDVCMHCAGILWNLRQKGLSPNGC